MQFSLGNTGITTEKVAFGALPVQRADTQTAVKLLRRAYEGGITFYDTARYYSDSEEKLGLAFEGIDLVQGLAVHGVEGETLGGDGGGPGSAAPTKGRCLYQYSTQNWKNPVDSKDIGWMSKKTLFPFS